MYFIFAINPDPNFETNCFCTKSNICSSKSRAQSENMDFQSLSISLKIGLTDPDSRRYAIFKTKSNFELTRYTAAACFILTAVLYSKNIPCTN